MNVFGFTTVSSGCHSRNCDNATSVMRMASSARRGFTRRSWYIANCHPGGLESKETVAMCRGNFVTDPSLVSRFIALIDHVSFRQHAFMQNARHENPSRLASEEYDVLALFDAA
jgi:hypothetical protein